MQLTPVNPNWAVRKYARHDLSMREGTAKANSARAWSNVYQQASGEIKNVTDEITKTSQDAEAQKIYNDAMKQITQLENSVLTEQQIPMDSPLMTGVTYDDSYQYVENGQTKTGNRGYASTHEVGNDIWQNQSMAIAQAFAGQGSSSAVQGAVASKLQNQLLGKTQGVSRHVAELAIADKRETSNSLISEAVRNGDIQGAINMANESYNQGIFNQKELNAVVEKSLQDNDMLKFQQQLSMADDEKSLSTLADVALFSTNYMTPTQKTTVANASLAKIDRNRKLQKQELADWNDNNETDAIIGYHTGTTNVTELIDNSHKYSRAGFTRLYERMTTEVPVMSNTVLNNDYQRRIINSPFEATPDNSMDDINRGIIMDMGNSVKFGTLSPADFELNKRQLETTAAAPFKSQQYIQAKKSLFVDILGTMDPGTLEEIQSAGVNISAITLQAMGQKANVSVLGIRAFEDLNTYMRSFGYQADPIQWWKDNKDRYKADNYALESANSYSATYPGDVVKLSNGQVDIRSTEDNLIRQYNNGVFGLPGSDEARRELDKRAGTLKGTYYGQ